MKKLLSTAFLFALVLLGSSPISASAGSPVWVRATKTAYSHYCTVTVGNDDSTFWRIYWPDGTENLGPALGARRTYDARRYPRIRIEASNQGVGRRVVIMNEACSAQF